MSNKSRYGLISLGCGVISCIAFLLHFYFAYRQIEGGKLLKFFDQLGLVVVDSKFEPVWKSSSLLSINDANAVLWLSWLGFYLLFVSYVYALLAEMKYEDTLYPSVGFIAGVMALGLNFSIVSIVVMILCSVLYFRMRGLAQDSVNLRNRDAVSRDVTVSVKTEPHFGGGRID